MGARQGSYEVSYLDAPQERGGNARTLNGDISLLSVDEKNEKAIVGYCLSRKHWRKGIMPEALEEVLRYLFAEVGFQRIESSHAVPNPASGRVMEKCGLLYEGTFRKSFRLLSTGEWVDIVHRAILREDYFARK